MYQFTVDLELVRGNERVTHRLEIQCVTESERNDFVEEYVEAKFAKGWTCLSVTLISVVPMN